MTTARAGYLSAGLLVAVCVLTSCNGPHAGVAQTVKPGVPAGHIIDPLDDAPAATWIERGTTFAIVTWGSGSCPSVATALEAESADHITVTFGPSPNDPCTADMAPTTHEFELPEEVDGTSLVIDVKYEEWPETHTLTLE